MGISLIQPSLSGGEIGPALWGRVDQARYMTSLKTCRNFIPQPTGGARNRPGTRYVACTKEDGVARLIPFQFSTTQTYALELGDYYMRVHMNGGPVLSGGVPVEISTPWPLAVVSELKWVQSADVITVCHPNYPVQTIGRTSHTAWTCTAYEFQMGPWQAQNVNAGITVSSSSTTGTVTLTASSALFTSSHVGMLFKLQQKDYGTPWEVDVAVSVGAIRRSDGKYYMAQNAANTGTLKPTHDSDSSSDGKVTWLYLHPGFGVALITAVAGDGKSATATVKTRLPDAACFVSGSSKTISAIANSGGSILATVTGHGFDVGSTNTVLAAITYVDTGVVTKTITGAYSAYAVDATHLMFGAWSELVNYSSFMGGTVVASSASSAVASYKWSFGAFGGDQGYPACTVYHQQRQVFAGTTAAPQTIWLSRTGDFHNFGTSSPVVDDDAITATFASTQVNAIKSMLPLAQMVVLTSGGEWVVSGSSSSSALTPSNLSAKLQGYRGASDLPPVGIGNTAIYVQTKGQIVRDLGYEFASDSYTGNDLLTFSPHLVEGHQIIDWAFQQHPASVIWCVRDDGMLLSCTYNREQQVIGWARHDTDGSVESICCISEDNEDAVYLIVKRSVNGSTKRFVERMATRVITDVRESFFVDAGLSFDGRNTSGTTLTLSGGTTWDEGDVLVVSASSAIFAYPATTDVGDLLIYNADDGTRYALQVLSISSTTVGTVRPNKLIPSAYRAARSDWAFARDTMSGLDHLEGKTVAALADGFVQDRQVVTNGKITLSPPAYRVHAGLPIQADLETLSIVVQQQMLLDKMKNIPFGRLLVQESRGIWAGRDFDHLYEEKTRSYESQDLPPSLITGLVELPIGTSWSKDGNLAIRQDDPLPITVLAIMPEVAVGGN